MNFWRSCYGTIFIFLFCAGLRAGEPGVSGGTFLKIGAGPRAISMGEAQVGLANDAYASYWNPAGLSQLTDPEAAFSYDKSIQNIQQEHATIALPIKNKMALGFFITHLSVDPFSSFNAAGAEVGQVDSSDWAYGLSWSQRIRSSIHVGINGKIIRSQLGPVSDATHAFDFGVLLKPKLSSFLNKFQYGFTLKNSGPSLVFDQDKTRLPRTRHFGVAFQSEIQKNFLTSTLDYNSSPDHRSYFNFGSEFWIRQILALRAGYRFGQDQEDGFRAGIGFGIRNLELSYSISPFGFLGEAHRFGVLFRFQPKSQLVITEPILPPIEKVSPKPQPKINVVQPKPKPKRKIKKKATKKSPPPKKEKKPSPQDAKGFVELGKDLMRNGRFKEAAAMFSKALQIEPNHQAALNLMRQAIKNINSTKRNH